MEGGLRLEEALDMVRWAVMSDASSTRWEERRKRLRDRSTEFATVLYGWKEMHPWRGGWDEVEAKFRLLHRAAQRVFGIKVRLVVDWEGGSSGESAFISLRSGEETIILKGKPSVVTYLHEFAHAMGEGEEGAREWSESMFYLVWPKGYLQLKRTPCGMLVKRNPKASLGVRFKNIYGGIREGGEGMNRMGPREVLRELAKRIQGLAETWDLWEPGTRATELSIFQERLRVLEKKEVAKALEGEP